MVQDTSTGSSTQNAPSSNSTIQDGDATEQIAILLKSMKILARLAAMNPTDYQASLQTKIVQSEDDESDTENGSVIHLQKALGDLQKGWRLEDTPAVQLCTSIHGLHSAVANLQKDAEEHTAVYTNLQQELLDSQKRNAKLERTLLRIHSKNQSLSQKVKQRSCEKRSLVQHVHACVQQVQESKEEKKQLEEQNVAFRLHAHHQFLQQQQQTVCNSPMRPGRGRSFSHDVLTAYPTPQPIVDLRSRGMSQDTNFSDMDALDFATSSADSFAFREDVVLDEEIGLGDVDVNGGYPHDDLSYCPSVASSTLVTDDGVATPLRLSRDTITTTAQHNANRQLDDVSPPDTPGRESLSVRKRVNSRDLDFGFGTSFLGGKWSSSKKKEPILVHDLTFPCPSSIGLKFGKLPSDSPVTNKKEVPKPKGLLTEAMLSSNSSHDSSTPSLPGTKSNDSVEKDCRQKSGFKLKWKVFSSRSSGGSQEEDKPVQTKENGTFVVSGYEGFLDEINERPAIGEKLIAINGIPVDGMWSTQELEAQLEKAIAKDQINAVSIATQEEKKCSEHDDTCLTLRFRKEPLTRKERDIMERAKHALEYCEDEWGLQCQKQSKDSANAGKHTASSSAASSSKLSFMDSLSPNRTKKGQHEIPKATNHDEIAIGEEEIQLSSSSSSEASTKPLFETLPNTKVEAQKKNSSSGTAEAEVESLVLEDVSTTKPTSATTIFSFFSPQKVEETGVVAAGEKGIDPDAKRYIGPTSKHKQYASAEKDPEKKSSICESPSATITKEKEDVSTGEKILDSVKSLGEFFANPYP